MASPSNRWPEAAAHPSGVPRRRALGLLAALPAALHGGPAAAVTGAEADAVATLLREGGVVLALRHALAPGTFDPPGFTLGDCRTQRNLDERGRAQARQLGQWMQAQRLRPTAVRSSPWCRCLDTATLAFGNAQAWAALGSPYGREEGTNAAALADLRSALARLNTGTFEVWVTHMFVLAALVPSLNPASGEGWVLRAGPGGAVQALARLPAP